MTAQQPEDEDWRSRGLLAPPVLDEEYAEYRDIAGSPRLRKAVVLFLDQLGTRNSVELDPLGHLQRTHAAVRLARRLAALSEDIPQVARWFSDNLLLGVRLPDEEVDYAGVPLIERGFGTVVIDAAWVQLALILGGMASRGGIDIGEFYADEQFLYGPALNGAYRLESRVAMTPRIVLSNAAVRRAIEEVFDGELQTYASMLAVDEDDEVFVNYLGDLPYTVEEERETIEPLEEHRDRVVGWLSQFKADSKLAAKYEWMASFHNWMVSKHLPPELMQHLTIAGAPARAFRAVDAGTLGIPEPDSE